MTDSGNLEDQARALLKATEAFRGLGGMTIIRARPPGKPTASVAGYDKVILVEAGRSAKRAEDGKDANDALSEAGGSVAAILCAAAACETWLSEYLSLFEAQIGLPKDLDAIRGMRDVMAQWRELFRIRAPDYSLGECRQYQALGCLMRLRDHVAHRHAREMALDSFPERLEDCVKQGIVPARKASGADWTSVIFVHEVARWAYVTSRDWILLADEVVPRPGDAAG